MRCFPQIEPVLPKLVKDVPRGRAWVCEVKLVGFRGTLNVDAGRGRFLSKTKKGMRRFDHLANAIVKECGWISKASPRNGARIPTRSKRSGRRASMRRIRRTKGGRICPIVGGREVAEVKGGGVPAMLGDELPHVRGWERGATVAARVGER